MSKKYKKSGSPLSSGTAGVLDCEQFSLYENIGFRTYSYLKRFADLVLSAFGLAILFVPFLFIMLIVFVDDPGPVFFSQYRVGLNGKHFKMHKFRSMKIDAPSELSTAEVKDPNACITRVGKIIRKYSIDELPQLYNVLIGDMSLVGPRPLILKEQDMHDLRNQYGVYSVRPGLTGLAQVNGRNALLWEEKFAFDLKYVNEVSFAMDVRVVAMTIGKVLHRSDVLSGDKLKKVAGRLDHERRDLEVRQ